MLSSVVFSDIYWKFGIWICLDIIHINIDLFRLTYCKRGCFRWGKITRKWWQDISRGGNFHDTAPIFLQKGIWVLFSRRRQKREKRENFHVYSTFTWVIALCKNCFPNFYLQSFVIQTFPHEGLGVKSRMCPPYPQRDRKRRLNGAVCRNHRVKRVVPCRC